jgi:hypothetical protein
MKVKLENVGSAIRPVIEVRSLKDEVWRRALGGKSPNIRLVDRLYTYSRTEAGVPVFHCRALAGNTAMNSTSADTLLLWPLVISIENCHVPRVGCDN